MRTIVLIAGLLLGVAAMSGCGDREQPTDDSFSAAHTGGSLTLKQAIFIGPADVWKLGLGEGTSVLMLAAEDYPYQVSAVQRPSRSVEAAEVEGQRFERLAAGTRITVLPGVTREYVTWVGHFIMGRIETGPRAGSTVILNELYSPPSFSHKGPYQVDAARAERSGPAQ